MTTRRGEPTLSREAANCRFDYWMAQETAFQREEEEACRHNRHDLAAAAHQQRVVCLDRALKALELAG